GVVGRDLLRAPGFVGNLRLEAIDIVGKVAVKRLREVELVVAPLAGSAKSLILSVESLDLSTEPVGHPLVVGDVVPLVGQSLAELDLEITSSVPEAFVLILERMDPDFEAGDLAGLLGLDCLEACELLTESWSFG